MLSLGNGNIFIVIYFGKKNSAQKLYGVPLIVRDVCTIYFP